MLDRVITSDIETNILDIIPLPIVIHIEGKIIYCNTKTLDIIGVKEASSLINKSIIEFVPVEDRDVVFKRINLIKWKNELDWVDIKIIDKKGKIFEAEAKAVGVEFNGQNAILSIFKDISARKKTERKLKEQKDRYKSLFEYNPDAIVTINLEGKFSYVNQATLGISGYSPDELMGGSSFLEFIDPVEVEKVKELFQRVTNGETILYETAIIHKRGYRVDIQVKGFPMKVDGQIAGMYSVAKDISQQKELQRKIETMAYFDAVTGMPNRNMLKTDFEMIESSCDAALLFIDLDNFKKVNDTFGHDMGDSLLKGVAERISSCLDRGKAYRLGGDEFIILLKDIDKKGTINAARCIINKLNYNFVIRGNEIKVTPSIGISSYPGDGQTLQQLIKSADDAMYEVKRRGKNNFQFYSG